MGKVVAVGGSSHRYTEARASIVNTILDATGKNRPKIVYIPTASRDARPGRDSLFFDIAFSAGHSYTNLTTRDIENENWSCISDADLIYVGGGDTRYMMKVWNLSGFSEFLKETFDNTDKVLSGASAGSICWFDGGLSDSERFSGKKDWSPIWVDGLGLIPLLHSPHYGAEAWRIEAMPNMLPNNSVAIGINDDSAILFDGTEFKVVGHMAFRCVNRDGRYVEEVLRPSYQMRNISELI